MSEAAGILIIGAGHAAGQAAASLRQEGYDGAITIVGDEPYIPYQRPPLSKQYLSGEQGIERVYLRPEKFYADKDVDVRTNTRVEAIDPSAKNATIDGKTLAWDELIIATGSRPRILNIPGSDLAGIHYLRTIADVDAIRTEVAPGRKVVIVGGGYIGLEVAAVCVEAGLEVHVLEMEERILQRVTTPAMSAYYHQLHESRGVHIHTNTRVQGFTGADGRITGVDCGDERFDADFAIVGIGIIPNVELAQEAGIECDNGIVVDERCRTSAPNVWAAGDCTRGPNPLTGTMLRLESVPNAMEQARVAAANICGKDKVYDAIPWFWSDQYELKLQMVGFSTGAEAQVLRGDQEANEFAVFYLNDGKIIAADAVNSPKEFMVCKQLIGKAVDAAVLQNPDTDLKTLLK